MLLKVLQYIGLVLLIQSNSFVFAQNSDRSAKLESLKAKNDLTNWIYEQLDEANSHPQLASDLIAKAQKQVWRQTQNAEEHFAWLNLLSTLGYYQLLDGKILQSIHSYESALVFFRKYQVLSYNIAAYVIKPLSNNYTRLGDYERALYLQRQALEFSIDNDEVAATYANMAISYRSMARFTDAYSIISKGLALKPSQFVRIMLNNILADVLYDDGKYNDAAAVIAENIKRQKATDAETAYWLIGSYTTAGNIFQKQLNLAKANQHYFKALHLLNQYFVKSRLRERANLYTKIANVYLGQSAILKANDYAKRTLLTLGIIDENGQIVKSRIYGDNMLVDAFMLLSKTHLQLNKANLALSYVDLSLLSANGMREEFAADLTKERLQNNLKKIVEQGIDISYQLYKNTNEIKYLHHILELAEQGKARTLLDQIRRNRQLNSHDGNEVELRKKQSLEKQIIYLEKQLQETNDKNLAKEIESLKFDLALLDKTLAKRYKHYDESAQNGIDLNNLPSHRFIEYFIGENNTYIININRNKIVKVLKLPNAEQTKLAIGNFVKNYFHQGPSAMMNNPKDFFNASYRIYQLILAPLNLKGNEKITVIPDGVLGYLSFDGLICKPNYSDNISGWPFLINNYLIDYGFSLKTVQAKTQHQSNNAFSGMFLTHSKGDKANLTYMAKEAELIGKQVAGTFLLDSRVNVNAFNKLFAKSNVLHIGTHAYLSGANAEPTLDFGKQKFYLFELSNAVKAPNLVVLSACQTADGVLANGEGIISMARGFNAVGSLATIASLWNVNDEAAATITASFYEHLGNSGNPVNALHEAKLSWIRTIKSSNSLLLPYYWDSLIYMGKNQEIAIKKPQYLKLPLIILLGLIAATAGLIFLKPKVINWR
ncbi:CHAT domain-containing protein [Pedobacter sp.]